MYFRQLTVNVAKRIDAIEYGNNASPVSKAVYPSTAWR